MTNITSFAQTFYVNATETPDGVFLGALDVCFSYKDDSFPITVQLCPTVNGIPDTTRVLTNSEVTMFPVDIPTTSGIGSDVPSFGVASTYTRFVFPGLVYLPPGQYAMVFKTNSVKYMVYVAKMQETILGTDRIVSKQPYVGSLFKSQNSDAWTPFQNEDLMFRLVRASFAYTNQGSVDFYNINPTANINMDTFCFAVNDIAVAKTKIGYGYKATTSSSGVLDTSYSPVMPNRNYQLSARGVLSNIANGSFRVSTSFTSDSEYVSPIIDPTRINVVAIENLINDGGLSNAIISITNSGTGYNVNAVPAVTISAPTRSGGVTATAVANVNSSTKTVDRITLTSVGSGYIETPTITIAHPPNDSGNANATAVITGETSKTGGNALHRYLTRKVVLTNGFQATDIKVFISACKRTNTDVQVYYKVLSDQDPDQNFDNKSWNRMNLDSTLTSVYSKNDADFIEYRYNTPNGNCSYSSGSSYYNSFRIYAIKICGFSSDPTIVPVVKELRGIALA